MYGRKSAQIARHKAQHPSYFLFVFGVLDTQLLPCEAMWPRQKDKTWDLVSSELLLKPQDIHVQMSNLGHALAIYNTASSRSVHVESSTRRATEILNQRDQAQRLTRRSNNTIQL